MESPESPKCYRDEDLLTYIKNNKMHTASYEEVVKCEEGAGACANAVKIKFQKSIIISPVKETLRQENEYDERSDREESNVNSYIALNRHFLLGVWTVNSPQSHIVRVYDAGHGKSGVFHSAEWHDGDWSGDGIREAWLWFFIWWKVFEFFGLAES
ncbi:hypothetical protein TNCV_1042781 [Trichonephila clavipes]|nr:hypothetical protein TNCV_1042781 [Trichonephila clavipes]